MIQLGCAGWLVLCGLCMVPFQKLGMSDMNALGAGAVLASIIIVGLEALYVYLSRRQP